MGKKDRKLLQKHRKWIDYLNWCFGYALLIPTSFTTVMDYIDVFFFLKWDNYDNNKFFYQ